MEKNGKIWIRKGDKMIIKIDKIGRIVLPANFRKRLGVENGGKLMVEFVDGEVVIKRIDEKDPQKKIDKAIEFLKENCDGKEEFRLYSDKLMEILEK